MSKQKPVAKAKKKAEVVKVCDPDGKYNKRGIEIWREQKRGKIRGRSVSWEEDCYRVSKPKEAKGKKVYLPSGEQAREVIVESVITQDFKLLHKEEYDAFIKENGERKDERYKN